MPSVNATEGGNGQLPGCVWSSTDNFDKNHLGGPVPVTLGDWVAWRKARWPSLGGMIPGATLITGDINAALIAGQYRNFQGVVGGDFTVIVRVHCSTVNPKDKNNSLSEKNVLISDFDGVELAGSYINDMSVRIVHLEKGVNY